MQHEWGKQKHQMSSWLKCHISIDQIFLNVLSWSHMGFSGRVLYYKIYLPTSSLWNSALNSLSSSYYPDKCCICSLCSTNRLHFCQHSLFWQYQWVAPKSEIALEPKTMAYTLICQYFRYPKLNSTTFNCVYSTNIFFIYFKFTLLHYTMFISMRLELI